MPPIYRWNCRAAAVFCLCGGFQWWATFLRPFVPFSSCVPFWYPVAACFPPVPLFVTHGHNMLTPEPTIQPIKRSVPAAHAVAACSIWQYILAVYPACAASRKAHCNQGTIQLFKRHNCTVHRTAQVTEGNRWAADPWRCLHLPVTPTSDMAPVLLAVSVRETQKRVLKIRNFSIYAGSTAWLPPLPQ